MTMRKSAVAFAALVLMSGCTGTRTPRLAKCAGPYRYANPYGTVLPSLPVSDQPGPAASTPRVVSPKTVPGTTPIPRPAVAAPATPTPPAKTGANLPSYPSC
jgi:hypothetical protein